MVTGLFLYPIKGLAGVRVPEARVLPSGALEFDRRWALVDSRERFVNGKNRNEVYSIRAAFDLARMAVTLDDQIFALQRDGAKIAAWFSARLGEPVEWRENTAMGFPDDTDSPGPTVVSSASVKRVSEWFGLSEEEVQRRFRYNIEFDGVEPFWEDQLYGSRFRVGEVDVDAVNPCQRCPVPSRDSLTGEADAGFQKRFAQLREVELPSAANRALFTHYYRFTVNTRIPAREAGKFVRLGDAVSFTRVL